MLAERRTSWAAAQVLPGGDTERPVAAIGAAVVLAVVADESFALLFTHSFIHSTLTPAGALS